jgi:hypothetical protein
MLADKKQEPRKAIAMADLPAQCESAYHWFRANAAVKGAERSGGSSGNDRSDPERERQFLTD